MINDVCEHGSHGCAMSDPEKAEKFKTALSEGFDDGMVRVRFPVDEECDHIKVETCWAEPVVYGTTTDDEGNVISGFVVKVRNVLAFYPEVSLDDLVITSGDPPNLEFVKIVSKTRDTYYIRYEHDKSDDDWKEKYKTLSKAFFDRQIPTASPCVGFLQICVKTGTSLEDIERIIESVKSETNLDFELDSDDEN